MVEDTRQNHRSRERLPVAQLRQVTDQHVHDAVRKLSEQSAVEPFGRSTDFDLLTDTGSRLPPKAVFGMAATFALGFPVLPKHFTGGLGSPAFAALESAGYRIVPKAENPAPKRNPNWTREETILALDLYARRRPQIPGQEDRDVIELSELLRFYARQRGTVGLPSFRNPDGVSMKLANLSRLEATDGRAGLRNGSELEKVVWAEFMPDVARLAAAASDLRAQILRTTPQAPRSAPAPSDASGDPAPSRGPAPSFGVVSYERADGENVVYLMRLEGGVQPLFPARKLSGRAVIKVGRSNDVERRNQQLNDGFPPGADLRWTVIQVRPFASGQQAHDCEQAILRRLSDKGAAIGREFAIVSEDELGQLLAAAD